MSAGLIGRSCGTATSSVEFEISSRSRRRDGQFFRSVRICSSSRGRNLRRAPDLVFSSSGRSFPWRIRARAAVEDGVAAAEAITRGKSFYELLGIHQRGSAAEIKKAYKEMARRFHPDVCPSPDRAEEYTRVFIEVQEAYRTLSDPSRRAIYDRDLAGGFNIAFPPWRRHYRYNCGEVVVEEKSQWKKQWADQLEGLKRKSKNRDSGNEFSWGCPMRRRGERDPFPE
ncbi:chaperone protein dnaJ 20, chloroplastic-like [Wolffia australiana]